MSRILLSLSIVLLLFTSAKAQTVSGRVTTATDPNGLLEANALLTEHTFLQLSISRLTSPNLTKIILITQ